MNPVMFSYPDRTSQLYEIGDIDGVVFCLSKTRLASLASGLVNTSAEDFRDTLFSSAFSFIDVIAQLRPKLRRPCSVVALSFFGSQVVVGQYGLMGVAKAALEQTIRTLAWELGNDGIRVNGVSAGAIETTSSRALPAFRKTQEILAERSPLRRGVTREEVASTILWLLSEASGGLTAEVINVNGGVSHVAFGALPSGAHAAGEHS
jgi:enoyl-[acyl-carrier protein] reductase I